MTDHHLDCQEFPHKVNLLNFSFFSSDRNNLIVTALIKLHLAHVSV